MPPPPFEGATPTVRRILNYYRLTWEWYGVRTELRSYPARLCVEATGACNLACPHCFTGAGEGGRPRSPIPLALYRRLLDEVGPWAWQVELHNWGEPLLNRNLGTMIADASARGLSTALCTNLSFPFDERRAEEIVAAGLKVIGVSIDGATQATYEQYRVGGRLDLVLANCRLLAEAKRRLRSRTPRMVWGLHVFAHNRDDVEPARRMAAELGMDFHASRGRVVGDDWDPDERWMPHDRVAPMPCYTLFHTAVVMSDGGMPPCRGSFYPEDDVGTLSGSDATFRSVWNGERYRLARRFFRRRAGSAEERRHICFGCPVTEDWQSYVGWRMYGGAVADWKPTFDSNQRFNYFWSRRPRTAARRPGRAAG
jgi:pyruvate-formate lyase-activating enzyme